MHCRIILWKAQYCGSKALYLTVTPHSMFCELTLGVIIIVSRNIKASTAYTRPGEILSSYVKGFYSRKHIWIFARPNLGGGSTFPCTMYVPRLE
jgi:hypothetical protein